MAEQIEKSQTKRRRIPVPALVAVVWIGVYLFLKFVVKPPLPSSLIFMYMSLTTIGLTVYLSIYEDILQGFKGPVADFLRGNPGRAWHWRAARWVVLAAIPAYAGHQVYQRVVPQTEPPISSRVIHPAPPFETVGLNNILRRDPEHLKEQIEEGRRVYYQNCFFCHGDAWDGKGHFAYGIDPPPADFADPGTIAQLQESFVFWRISAGGPGLPPESTPWDSFMPRWETMLTEKERWQVILYLYAATGWSPRTWGEEEEHEEEPAKKVKAEQAGDDLTVGREIYEKHCTHCHGEKGAGDGDAAEFLNPRPRDFTQGLFKVRSTLSGQLPTDEDLFRVVSEGMPGTGMIGWAEYLDEKKRKQVIRYLKTFYSEAAQQKGTPTPMKIGKPPASSTESIARGKELFREMNCFICHGVEGRGNGVMAAVLKDSKGFPIRPANLTRNWDFRGGHRPEDIYHRVNGGIASTPMPAFAERLDEQKSWDLVHYVLSLSPVGPPPARQALKAEWVEGELPKGAEDPLWEKAEVSEYPLVGQVVENPRLFAPSVNAVRVQALYNDKEIALRLTWDDRTPSRTDPQTGTFEDALAVQFPAQIPTGTRRPYFLMGDSENAVNLWRWGSDHENVAELTANGSDRLQPQPESSQGILGSAAYHEGQYRLVMKRAMATSDNALDIQFRPGLFIPMAFYVWDGSNHETGKQMALSRWYYILLEPPLPATVYLFPGAAVIMVVGAEWWFIRRIRMNKGGEQ